MNAYAWIASAVLLMVAAALTSVPTNGSVTYNTQTGAVSAQITVTVVTDDRPCDCNPAMINIHAGCPASGLPVLAWRGQFDAASGVVSGTYPEVFPGLDPQICAGNVQLTVVCWGENPCPWPTECVAITCT
jgi:hypothetical protein